MPGWAGCLWRRSQLPVQSQAAYNLSTGYKSFPLGESGPWEMPPGQAWEGAHFPGRGGPRFLQTFSANTCFPIRLAQLLHLPDHGGRNPVGADRSRQMDPEVTQDGGLSPRLPGRQAQPGRLLCCLAESSLESQSWGAALVGGLEPRKSLSLSQASCRTPGHGREQDQWPWQGKIVGDEGHRKCLGAPLVLSPRPARPVTGKATPGAPLPSQELHCS